MLLLVLVLPTLLVLAGARLLATRARPVAVPLPGCLAAAGLLGAGTLLAAATGGFSPGRAGVLGALGSWVVLLSAADLVALRLPDVLTLPGAGVVLAVAAATGHGAGAAAGALALAGAHAVVHLLAPAALGAGDVKLALGVGAAAGACGAPTWVLAALGAAPLTALLAVVLVLRGRRGPVAHGPGMAVAALVAVAAALG